MRGVYIALNVGLIRTVNKSFRILNHLFAGRATLVVIEANPVSTDHHLAALDFALNLVRLVKVVWYGFDLETRVLKGVR